MTYTIIDKEEFTALYKFGEIPLKHDRVLVSNNERDLRDSLLDALKELPFFEYEEEFLIVSLDSKPTSERLHISGVSGLIPLSERAKNSYERKFDPRIKFRAPQFVSILDDYFEYVELMDHKNGAKALSQMFDCRGDYSELVTDKHLLYARRKKNNGERSHSFQGDFFTHLFVYDRYDFFPRTDLGYLYDLGTILANSKGRPEFVGSRFHTFLEKNQSRFNNLKLRDLFKEMAKSYELEGLRSNLSLESGLRLYIAATIFLKYKDECKEADSIYDMTLGGVIGTERKNHEFIAEFELAIYLTGLFFGFQKFNSDYYQTVNLRIFQDEGSVGEVHEHVLDGGDVLEGKENAELKEGLDEWDNSNEAEKFREPHKDDLKLASEGEIQDQKEKPVKEADFEWKIPSQKLQSERKGESSEEEEAVGTDKRNLAEDLGKNPSIKQVKPEIASGLTEKEEAKIKQLEEIFDKKGVGLLRISSVKKELGYSTNQPIKNIVNKDQKVRFKVTKDDSADALTRSESSLFNETKQVDE